MEIKILGTGCEKCSVLESNAKEAAKLLGMAAQFEKVQDLSDIMSYGVMKTPALVIDGNVEVMGKLATVEEIKSILEKK
ncbi:thioredoxin family protein [Tindallia californiensis]|uniref:Small redox-active disulfide protein 2 n=1 Tax=Tindallia californiensis TaxID=159292 RepID=A0A1H3JZN6_9FIRM|nr:thioredoxin family protein [Tindallia californiensis]SDY44724.1 small redox-active disulfide protein 2 [Tindallia californiensis]